MRSLLKLELAQISRFGGISTRTKENVWHLCTPAVKETLTTLLARINVNPCAR